VGFLGKFVRLIGVLERSLGMPSSGLVIPFFIVFGGCAMSLGRKFVLLGGFPVCLVHVVSSRQDGFPNCPKKWGRQDPHCPPPTKI
jgi:hypothetical protein